MTATWTIIAVAATAAAIGARLGGRRLMAIVVGTATAGALTPTSGPSMARWMTPHVDWEPWVLEVVCWGISYAAVAWAVTYVAMRVLGRGAAAGPPSRTGRLIGAALGSAIAGVCAWLAVGNLADVVVQNLPAGDSSPTVAAIRRPFEIVRACRVLSTLSDSEAEMLLERQDIRAVMEADSLDRLLRTPGVLRKVSRAADGDWGALTTLAADPAVKEAMNGPELLERIRAVDVVAMAADVERSRAGAEAGTEKTIGDRSAGVRPLAARGHWARRLAEDPEFQERIAEEWYADRPDRALARRPEGRATEEEVRTYWRTVGTMLELADGPNLPQAWLPGFELPSPPTAGEPSTARPAKP